MRSQHLELARIEGHTAGFDLTSWLQEGTAGGKRLSHCARHQHLANAVRVQRAMKLTRDVEERVELVDLQRQPLIEILELFVVAAVVDTGCSRDRKRLDERQLGRAETIGSAPEDQKTGQSIALAQRCHQRRVPFRQQLPETALQPGHRRRYRSRNVFCAIGPKSLIPPGCRRPSSGHESHESVFLAKGDGRPNRASLTHGGKENDVEDLG